MEIIHDRERAPNLGEFLLRPLFAYLATTSEDGPRDSPVWFLWEDDALWIIGNEKTDTFPKRIQKDPRCAVGIVDFDVQTGLVEHVGMRGRAVVEPFEVGRARTLLRRYLGADESAWDERFKAALTDRDSLLVRFEPQTIVVRDVSYTNSAGGAGRANYD